MLSVLTALLAFAAVMILLSTLVTVMVEAIQKVWRQRRKGFEQMMHALYRDVVGGFIGQTAQPATTGSQQLQESFAREIMLNPVFEDRGSQLRNWLGRIFRSDFENMDTRAFVEQLANTEAGKSLASQAEATLKKNLATIAYQFERYGEAASAYFAKRARLLAVIVAIALAFALNVDALFLFKSLMRDPSLSENIVSQVDVQALQKSWDSVKAADTANAGSASKAMDEAVASAQRGAAELATLGVPVGRDYFPFCSNSAADSRCPAGGDLYKRADFWIWLLSALAAGGLIGLGAPFWYDLYRKIAFVIPIAKVASKYLGDGQQVVAKTQPDIEKKPIRRPEQASLSADELVTAFRRAGA